TGNSLHHVGGAHQLAHQQKERDGQQRFVIDAVENFLNDGGERHLGQHRSDKNTGQERERDRHAEISERQKAKRHRPEDEGGRHATSPSGTAAASGGMAAGSSGGSG